MTVMTEEAERAYRKALFILERRDHTESELQKKLCDKEFSKESIAEAMERLKEYGLVNDRRFTEQYLRYHYTEQSKRVLLMKLMRKGIQADLFESVYAELALESETKPELEALQKALGTALRKAERRGCCLEELSQDEKNRIIAVLYRKGFSLSLIQAELKKTVESF